jgi:uncharacterized protein YecA (UPF0149 family)
MNGSVISVSRPNLAYVTRSLDVQALAVMLRIIHLRPSNWELRAALGELNAVSGARYDLMSNLDCVDRLREEIARASEAQARKLNLSLKLLAHARGQNEDRGRHSERDDHYCGRVFQSHEGNAIQHTTR